MSVCILSNQFRDSLETETENGIKWQYTKNYIIDLQQNSEPLQANTDCVYITCLVSTAVITININSVNEGLYWCKHLFT